MVQKTFSISITEETDRIREQARGMAISPLISRELGRYRELMEKALPELSVEQLRRLAHVCRELRESSAGLWWLVVDEKLHEAGIHVKLTKVQELALCSFVDRLGDSPAEDDIEKMLIAWGKNKG